jgi:hypothetical protein
MDNSADDYATNALKKRKEELRREAKAKEFCDGMIDGAVSQLHEAQEKNGEGFQSACGTNRFGRVFCRNIK